MPTPPTLTYVEQLLSVFKTALNTTSGLYTPWQTAKNDLWGVLQTSTTRACPPATDIWHAYLRSLYGPTKTKLLTPSKAAAEQTPLEAAAATAKLTFNSSEWETYELGCKTGYKWFLSGEERLLPLIASLKANPFAVIVTQTPFWLGSVFAAACLLLCLISTARTRLSVLALLISFTALLLVVNIACYPFVLGPSPCSFSLSSSSKLIPAPEVLLRGLLPKYYVLPTQNLPSIRDPAFSLTWNNYKTHQAYPVITQSNYNKKEALSVLLPPTPKKKTLSPLPLHFAPPFATKLAQAYTSKFNFEDLIAKPNNQSFKRKNPLLGYLALKVTTPYHPTQWWLEDVKHPKWPVFYKNWTFSDKRTKSYNQVYLEKALKTSTAFENSCQLKLMLINHLSTQNPKLPTLWSKPAAFFDELALLYSPNNTCVGSLLQGIQWGVDANNPKVRMAGSLLPPARFSKTTGTSLFEPKINWTSYVTDTQNAGKGFKRAGPSERVLLTGKLYAANDKAPLNYAYWQWVDSLARQSQLWRCWARGDLHRTTGQQYLIGLNQILVDFEVNPKKSRWAFWRHYNINYRWFKHENYAEAKARFILELQQLNPLPQVVIHKMGNTHLNADSTAKHQLAQMLSGGVWLAAPANVVITCSSLIGSLLVIVLNSTHLYSLSSPTWRTYFVTTATKAKTKAKKIYKDWYNFKRLYYVYGGIGYLEYTSKEKLSTELNLQPLFRLKKALKFSWWRRTIQKLGFTEVPVTWGFILVFVNLNLLPSGQPAYVVGSTLALAMAHAVYQQVPQKLNLYRQERAASAKFADASNSGKLPRYSWLVGDYERSAKETSTLYTKISEQTMIVRKYTLIILPSVLLAVYLVGHWLVADVDQHRFAVILTCSYSVFCALLGLPLYFAFVRHETIEFFGKNAVTRLIWAYRQTFFVCYLWVTLVYLGVATTYFQASPTMLGVVALTALTSLLAYFEIPANHEKHYIHRILLSAFLCSYLWLNLYAFGFFVFHETAFAFIVGCACVAVAVGSRIPTNLFKERVINPEYTSVSWWNIGILTALVSTGVFWTWELDLSRGVNSGSWLRESYVIMFLVWFAFACLVLSWLLNPVSIWRSLGFCAFMSVLLLCVLSKCEFVDPATTVLSPQTTAAWVLCVWAWSFVRLWRYFIVTGSLSAYLSYIIILLPSVLAVQNNLWTNYIGVNSALVWSMLLLAEILVLVIGISPLPKKAHKFSVLSCIGYKGVQTQSAKQLFFIFSVGLQLLVAGLLVYTGHYQVCAGAVYSVLSMFTAFVGALFWSSINTLTLSDKISDLRGALTTSRFLRKYAYTYGFVVSTYCCSVFALLVYIF